MRYSSRFFQFIIVFMMTIAVQVQGGTGRTGAKILSLGGGTRAGALGDAFVAVNEDVSAIFWNPSGLGDLSEGQALLSYTNYSQLFEGASSGLHYTFLAGAMPIGTLGVFAATLQLEGQGEIAVTKASHNVEQIVNLGTNWALTLSHADRVTDRLLMGVSGKIISQKLWRHSGSAFAIDLGTQYELPRVPIPIRLGVAIQNLGTRVKFKDENQSDPLPRSLRWGLQIGLLDSGGSKLQVMADLVAAIDQLKSDDDEIDEYLKNNPGSSREDILSDRGIGIHAFELRHLNKSFGIEYKLGNLLALRVGYKKEAGVDLPQFNDHLSYGFGARIRNYQFDFASTPGGGPNNKRLSTLALKLMF